MAATVLKIISSEPAPLPTRCSEEAHPSRKISHIGCKWLRQLSGDPGSAAVLAERPFKTTICKGRGWNGGMVTLVLCFLCLVVHPEVAQCMFIC